MSRSGRPYGALLVSIAVLSVLAPFASPIFLPTPIDAAVETAFWFVRGAAAWCVGADLYERLKARKQKARA